MNSSFLKNLNFPKVKSSQELLKPLFFLYKCHGMFPYKIRKDQITISKFNLAYSLLISIGSIILYIIIMYQCHVSNGIEFDTVEGLLQFDSYFALATFILIATSCKSKSMLTFLKKFLEVSSMLNENDLKQLAIIIYLKDAVGFFFLIGQVPNTYSKIPAQMLGKIYGELITLIVFLSNSQYSNYILILKRCFSRINNDLESIVYSNNYGHLDPIKSVMKPLQVKHLQLIKLRIIQQKHHKVCTVMRLLNSVFALPVIATVIMTFAETTFGLYFFLLLNQGKKSIDLEKQIWYNYFLTSVTYHFLKLTILIWICQETKNEASKTGIIVHNIILRTDNEELRAELNMFSLHLLQSPNEFSSKCIKMDAQLITAVVSGITTYLLILMQFLKMKVEPRAS
ncbi:uncharacterized protein LOC106658544 [Trichogramma pretiosum]|uniref:uncharacterized protein LOC106658544 n=1 Tax=Trichogramma pretiosum TaxID=7493 RepID=UPI0006C99B67|nr:uncharacterized protein LOC106658544 [Trichogramma pretiosum]